MSMINRITHFLARNARKIPILVKLKRFIAPNYHNIEFSNSNEYWKARYSAGGNSGEGSYGQLARYKAQFINEFCDSHKVDSVIEFGCGDGNQAGLFNFENYTGVDIVPACIEICKKKFSSRDFIFLTSDEYSKIAVDRSYGLSISLDVIYHLIEDEVYFNYLNSLFKSSSKYCLVYSSDFGHYDAAVAHVKHRNFTKDVNERFPDWNLIRNEKNPFEKPHDSMEYGSFASFYLFERS